MKTIKNVGCQYKEKVKNGELLARDAFDALIQQANKNGGAIGVAVFRQSKAAKWLSRRCR